MDKRRSVLVLLSERGAGDRPPVIALALGLRDRGDQVTVLCDPATERQIRSSGLATLTIPPEIDPRGSVRLWVKEYMNNGRDPASTKASPMVDWANVVQPFAIEVAEHTRPDLVIGTLFCMALADMLAKKFKIPWCFVNPSFYFDDPPATAWADDWDDITKDLARYYFLPLVQRADIVLHATDYDFDFRPSQLPNNHYHVGFLLWEPAAELPNYLDQAGDPWALVTASTRPQKEEMTLVLAAAKALAGQPVRTLLTVPDENARNELGFIPDNATLAGFVLHSPVLERSSILVSHAGHGIVSKALYHGVPMVLLPWSRDQPGVATRAEQFGVAKVVQRSEVNADTVGKAVATIFEDPSYRETAAHASARLQTTDSVDLACRLLKDV
jgi:UDP:flavonoid glycosyltransferase YjiC (YdhE family)